MRSLLYLPILLLTNSSTVLAANLLGEGMLDVTMLMTQEELYVTGVDNLSAVQVHALNEWLIKHIAKEASVAISSSEELKDVRVKPISSRVVGIFKGWRGTDPGYLGEWRMANGEVWQQRHKVKWIVTPDNPEVVIDKNGLGFYRMTFVKQGKAVGVKLID